MRRNASAIAQREVDRRPGRRRHRPGRRRRRARRQGRRPVADRLRRCRPQKASAEAALREAQVALDKTLVVAGTDGIVQQFALRAGDVVNPMLRPAGILVPDAPRHRPGRRLRPDRGAGDQGRHGRRGHLLRHPLHRHPRGRHRRAGRHRRGPDPPDRPAPGRLGLRPPRHDHRDHGAALRGRPRPAAAGQPLHRQRLHLEPRRARRTRTSAPSTPSSCTPSTPPASSTPRSSGCRR